MRTWIMGALAASGACATADNPVSPQDVRAARIEAPSGTYRLEPNHSSLVLRVDHFGLSRYTLRLTELSATLEFDAADPTRSTLVATAAADSVAAESPGVPDFEDELEGPDWLDAAAYPQIEFRSTAIQLTAPNAGRVAGELTLHGVTRPMTLEIAFNGGYAQHPFGRPISQLGFSARGFIRRSEFGMNTFLPDPIGVGDEVEIVIEAEFYRPHPA